MKTIKGIEVFAVGKWNGMAFQAHDLAAMAASFEKLKAVHKVPLKLGHNKEQPLTDGKPALGWVTAIYVKGDKLVADFEGVPEVVARAIQNKLYRRVSIELSIDVKYQGEFIPFVVDAVALLGADLPAVNTLADLEAFMSADAAQFSVDRRAAFSAVAGSITEEPTMDAKEVKDIVDSALKPIKEMFSQVQTAQAELTQKNKDLTTANAALTEQVATFKKNEEKGKVDTKRQRIKEVLEGLTASKVILPAQREAFKKAIGIDDDAKVIAFDIEAFVAGFDVKETKAGNGKVAFSKKDARNEDGDTTTTKEYTFDEAQTALDKRTRELMAERKLSYSAAKVEALNEDESLAIAYAAGAPADAHQ